MRHVHEEGRKERENDGPGSFLGAKSQWGDTHLGRLTTIKERFQGA
jgi:hypothetical protein